MLGKILFINTPKSVPIITAGTKINERPKSISGRSDEG